MLWMFHRIFYEATSLVSKSRTAIGGLGVGRSEVAALACLLID